MRSGLSVHVYGVFCDSEHDRESLGSFLDSLSSLADKPVQLTKAKGPMSAVEARP